MDLGLWSALDLGRSKLHAESRGPFAGLATLNVPRDAYGIVRARIRRDSIHRGPTRAVRFDCLACAACCVSNRVVLEDADVDRFEVAGCGALARPPYARRDRDDGSIVLVLRRDGTCKHLGEDSRCGIYAIRPNACSAFPIGSECCLSSREDELGLVDGSACTD